MEIARRIEEAMAGRNHRPSEETLQNFADLPQGNSRDIAAESVGWSGGRAAEAPFQSAAEFPAYKSGCWVPVRTVTLSRPLMNLEPVKRLKTFPTSKAGVLLLVVVRAGDTVHNSGEIMHTVHY